MTRIFISYIYLTWEATKLNILSAMEYRVSFFMQVIGMGINDIGLLLMWGLFFTRFPVLNGWRYEDTVLVFAFNMLNFGICYVFAGGIEDMSRIIVRGGLDHFLALPKNTLWQLSTSKCMISAIGDCIFGIALFFIFAHVTWASVLWFFVLAILTAMILYNFNVILHSMSFYMDNFEETADRIRNLVTGLSLYPSTPFYGVLKLLTFTFLPVFFISWAPVSIITQFSWIKLAWVFGFWLFSLMLAIHLFNRGLRLYESGNLINVRM